MKRCLVTGATGFVGNNVVRRLVADGHEVHLLLREGHSDWRVKDLRSDVGFHLADLHDEDRVQRVIDEVRPEWIFHLATYGAYSWQQDVTTMLRTNVLGAAVLLNACVKAGFDAFVHAGSSSEYGFKAYAPAEDSSLEPNSYYAVSKASAALLCRYVAQKYDLRIPVLRLYSVYGPYEAPHRLIPTLILRGLENSFPPLVDPETSHDFIYVDDVTDAFVLAAQVENQPPGEIFNVGTGVQTTLKSVVEVAREELGIVSEPQWGAMTGREWDTNIWICDNRHIKEILGWSPKFPFRDGFRQTVDWLMSHREIMNIYRRSLSES